MQARKNLEFVRGTHDVDKEFNDLVEAAELAKQVRHPWRNMFSRKYRPQIVLCACSTHFQQWTGYAPPSLPAPPPGTMMYSSVTCLLV